MKITKLQAYKRLEEMFKQKGYSQGIKAVSGKRKDIIESLRVSFPDACVELASVI